MESLPIPDEQPSASPLLLPASPAQTGRPGIYTEALADRIIEAIFEGHGLHAISQMAGMPSAMTITRWRHSNPVFRSLYEEARKLQLDLMAGFSLQRDTVGEFVLFVSPDTSGRFRAIHTSNNGLKTNSPTVSLCNENSYPETG